MKKMGWSFIGLSLIILFLLSSVGMSYFGQKTGDLDSISNNGDGGIATSYDLIPNSSISVTHPSDFTLNVSDSTNKSISWTLTDDSYQDYLGAYSFTIDPLSFEPAGWNVSEPSGTTIQVISGKMGHPKVLEFYDNSPTLSPYIYQTWPGYATGAIEFWMQVSTATTGGLIAASDYGTNWNWWLDWSMGYFRYFDSSGLHLLGTAITPNHWYHIRIQWNCAAMKWWCWIDGVSQDGGGGWSCGSQTWCISEKTIRIYGGEQGSTNVYQYIDAIDYSWAPGYYPNRNMDYYPVDYFGTYSFTAEPNEAYPAGWNIYEPVNSSLRIIESKRSSHKVLEFLCNKVDWNACYIYNSFTPQTTGSIELWAYIVEIEPHSPGSSDTTQFMISLLNSSESGPYFSSSTCGPSLLFENGGIIQYNAGYKNLIRIGTWTPNKWQHYRIDFNASTDKFDVYQDNIKIGNQCSFRYPQTALKRALIGYGWYQSHTMDCEVYVDAIDFSWMSGYYLNRNMNYNHYNLTYAIFENGVQKTAWRTWSTQLTINYNVSGISLGAGIHNISLVYNDGTGNWLHDDVKVTVTVVDVEKPNILGVFQNPINPTYQDSVNVTAHILDATQVQTVSIQTNYTGTFASYPMIVISGSLKDGLWKFSFGNYPVNKSIFYCISARDIGGNQNNTDYHSFGYFDTLGPNIFSISQDPPNPTYQDIVDVTAHILDATQVQTVSIQTNYTGTLASYPMTLISGSYKKGVWKFSFDNFLLNTVISYCIYTRDIFGNSNSSAKSSFIAFASAPKLLSGTVLPTIGTQFTNFTFRVVYQDDDNDPPGFINVMINGTPYQLAKADPSDLNYRDGCIYQYQTALALGTYYYSFRCSDGLYSNSTNNYGGLTVNKANQFAPQLMQGVVTPTAGTQFTNFTFQVVYQDADNDPPVFIDVVINKVRHPMVKQNSSGINYTYGCTYQFKTQLPPGTYRYSFECSDRNFSNSPSITCLGLVVYNVNIPTITNFTILTPQSIIHNKAPEIVCRIFVSGEGINCSSVKYAFSTNGNLNPTNWAPVDGIFLDAACRIPARNGALGNIYLKVNTVPFNQSSLTANIIRFRVSDMAGIQVVQVNSFTIKITEESPSKNPVIIIFMVIASAINCYIVNFYVHNYRREKKFQSIMKKGLTELKIPVFVDSAPPITTQHLSSCNTTPQVAEILPTDIPRTKEFKTPDLLQIEEFETIRTTEEMGENPQGINYSELSEIMDTIIKLFPSLKSYFSESNNSQNLFLYLRELKSMPDTEIFAFLSAVIGKIPEKELRSQISNLKADFEINEFIKANSRPLLNQVKMLCEGIESIESREVMNDLSVFLILSKCSLDRLFLENEAMRV